MKTMDVVNGPQKVSRIILGCMRMPALSADEAANMIESAYQMGVNFFDHATCYGDGDAETHFGEAFPRTGLKREEVVIQSKCGIHPERKVKACVRFRHFYGVSADSRQQSCRKMACIFPPPAPRETHRSRCRRRIFRQGEIRSGRTKHR